ncbi:hypothetical protein [Celeribacter litoreus]|uniref:hypothetical protein n=1 Tax=Celeribacter litoreus TaxID=2876714 RepID=UPI001CCF79F1|nr:hypothetical protein [Celeribacter litoreus]MCA0043958.1 hypothetical protein [Celeribacter litoreus]
MRYLFAALLAVCASSPALADETTGKLSVEINAVETVDGGCRLSFLLQNGLPSDLTETVFETVLFDQAGQVSQMTLLDFGVLPMNRPRVRQFVLSGTACTEIGGVLINGAQSCQGETVSNDACEEALEVTSKTEIEVLG